MAGEEEQYSRGLQRTVSRIKGWRICWQICYDLRFPVWCRNQGDYDILVFVANWPANRGDVWNTLLRARAIENQCYVLGVNRIGKDGNHISYHGDSSVIDPKGNRINDPDKGEEKLIYAELSYSSLMDFRKKFPVLRDADKFMIRIEYPSAALPFMPAAIGTSFTTSRLMDMTMVSFFFGRFPDINDLSCKKKTVASQRVIEIHRYRIG